MDIAAHQEFPDVKVGFPASKISVREVRNIPLYDIQSKKNVSTYCLYQKLLLDKDVQLVSASVLEDCLVSIKFVRKK